jgi:hypothetical protein
MFQPTSKKRLFQRRRREVADNLIPILLNTSTMTDMTLSKEKPNMKEISDCNGFDTTGCESGSTMNSFTLSLLRILLSIHHGVIAGKSLSYLDRVPKQDLLLLGMLMSHLFARLNIILMSLQSVSVMLSSEQKGQKSKRLVKKKIVAFLRMKLKRKRLKENQKGAQNELMILARLPLQRESVL